MGWSQLAAGMRGKIWFPKGIKFGVKHSGLTQSPDGMSPPCCSSEVEKSFPKGDKSWDKNAQDSPKALLRCSHPTAALRYQNHFPKEIKFGIKMLKIHTNPCWDVPTSLQL